MTQTDPRLVARLPLPSVARTLLIPRCSWRRTLTRLVPAALGLAVAVIRSATRI